MSMTLMLLIIAAICGLVALVVHVALIVHAFKKSAGWGLACLLVPPAVPIFAFAGLDAKGKPILVGLYLAALIGAVVCGGVASYQTAQAAIGGEAASRAGMEEFEKATQALDGLDDLQLNDLAPSKAKRGDGGAATPETDAGSAR